MFLWLPRVTALQEIPCIFRIQLMVSRFFGSAIHLAKGFWMFQRIECSRCCLHRPKFFGCRNREPGGSRQVDRHEASGLSPGPHLWRISGRSSFFGSSPFAGWKLPWGLPLFISCYIIHNQNCSTDQFCHGSYWLCGPSLCHYLCWVSLLPFFGFHLSLGIPTVGSSWSARRSTP